MNFVTIYFSLPSQHLPVGSISQELYSADTGMTLLGHKEFELNDILHV